MTRQERFSGTMTEDACPRQIWQPRRRRCESRADRLFSQYGMLYDSVAVMAWGSILRDGHRGRPYYTLDQVLANDGELLAGASRC
jgi:hypothetical protein